MTILKSAALKYGLIGFGVGALLIALQAGIAAPRNALAEVAPGRWRLTEIGGSDSRSVCIADPGALLHVQQPDAACTRFVMDSDRDSMTVRYTCGGRGHGRSVLTVRSRRSIRLETHGIAAGMPFSADYDGRFVGPCGG